MPQREEGQTRILVVEDSRTQSYKLRHLLEKEGYGVAIASDAYEALSYLERQTPNLIISDVIMPSLDGFAFCQAIKDSKEHRAIPVLLLTALSEPESIIKGLRCGAEGFIIKPYDDTMLLERVQYILTNLDIRKRTRSDRGIEVFFAGQKHIINPNRVQILDMLFSTYESLHQKSKELQQLNDALNREIQERRRTEAELRQLRNLLSNIINSMPSMLIGVDAFGNVTQWNNQAKIVTQIPEVDALGRKIADILPWFHERMDQITTAIRDRHPYKKERIPQEVDGQPRYFDLTVYPLIANGIEGAVIRIDDVTEKVNIEELMIQTEKMLSVGGLAAGMAHEINNPLAGILNSVQVVINRLQEDSEANQRMAGQCDTSMDRIGRYVQERGISSMLDAVVESAKRAAKIVADMLFFSHKSESDLVPQDLGELMDKTIQLAMSDYDLKKKYDFRQITIHREYAEPMPLVACDGAKIQQVFLNLLKNAAQVMTRSNTESPQLCLRISADDQWAFVEVEDNGPGMEEDVRRRVFEPFFTTKGVGEGTGLGLYVSYFIITENHRGTMTVDSSPGVGTLIHIGLPLQPADSDR